MQDSDNNIITHTDTVKLLLPNSSCWHGRMQENITMQFHWYSEVIVTVNDETICCRMKSYISEHLENIYLVEYTLNPNSMIEIVPELWP